MHVRFVEGKYAETLGNQVFLDFFESFGNLIVGAFLRHVADYVFALGFSEKMARVFFQDGVGDAAHVPSEAVDFEVGRVQWEVCVL